MRLCSYVVVHDTGFAPNPFGGYCTLAACTPNRLGLKLQSGDWLVGHTTKATGNRLLYAMRVSEVLDFDDYFNDPRFQAKKPKRGGTWQERAGDNIYYRVLGGWEQAFTYAHREREFLEKDTRRPRVFISDHFFYFGENAVPFPAEFASLIWTGQGARCNESPLGAEFVQWLEGTFHAGRHGNPRDRDLRPGEVAEDQVVRSRRIRARRC
jgi:hypothetical protein